MHWNETFNLLRCKVEWVLEAVSGFTNPFSSSFEDNELSFLSCGVPAKPVKAKDLIEADDIGRKAVADFIDSLLVKTICLSHDHKMLQANKVLRLARSSKKKMFNLQNVNSPISLKGAPLVSMTVLLDIVLTLSWHCHSFWDLYHGHCQLHIEFPPKLTSPNCFMACSHTLNQH